MAMDTASLSPSTQVSSGMSASTSSICSSVWPGLPNTWRTPALARSSRKARVPVIGDTSFLLWITVPCLQLARELDQRPPLALPVEGGLHPAPDHLAEALEPLHVVGAGHVVGHGEALHEDHLVLGGQRPVHVDEDLLAAADDRRAGPRPPHQPAAGHPGARRHRA